MPTANHRSKTTIAKMRKSLDEIFDRADKSEELQLRNDLAKYACMRLTGFLEQALVELGRECVKNRSGGAARSYSLSYLEKSFNPKRDAILRFIGRFDSAWRNEIEVLLDEDERGNSLSSLVGIRNQIAHGKDQGISIDRLRDYRKVVDFTVDHLIARFAP